MKTFNVCFQLHAGWCEKCQITCFVGAGVSFVLEAEPHPLVGKLFLTLVQTCRRVWGCSASQAVTSGVRSLNKLNVHLQIKHEQVFIAYMTGIFLFSSLLRVAVCAAAGLCPSTSGWSTCTAQWSITPTETAPASPCCLSWSDCTEISTPD